jgi:hypothetical protein
VTWRAIFARSYGEDGEYDFVEDEDTGPDVAIKHEWWSGLDIDVNSVGTHTCGPFAHSVTHTRIPVHIHIFPPLALLPLPSPHETRYDRRLLSKVDKSC